MLHFVGVGAGNSSAKVVTQLEGCDASVHAIVPNVSAFAEELDVPPASPDSLERLDLEILDPAEGYDGERFVGSLASKQLAQDVVQDRSRDKADSDNINLITPALLSALCEPGDKVVLGIGHGSRTFNRRGLALSNA